jgi:hypothetical protein
MRYDTGHLSKTIMAAPLAAARADAGPGQRAVAHRLRARSGAPSDGIILGPRHIPHRDVTMADVFWAPKSSFWRSESRGVIASVNTIAAVGRQATRVTRGGYLAMGGTLIRFYDIWLSLLTCLGIYAVVLLPWLPSSVTLAVPPRATGQAGHAPLDRVGPGRDGERELAAVAAGDDAGNDNTEQFIF